MKNYPFATFIAALAASAPLFFGGCTGQREPTGKRIIILTNGNSPYWDACREGLKAAEKDLKLADHGLRAVMEVNDGKPSGQIERLRQYATQSDIAAIGISVTDAGNVAIADEMRNLRGKGIPVLTIDGDVDRAKLSDARFAFVGTDNLKAGAELGKAIKNLRPEGSEMVTFVGRVGAQNAIDRKNGVVAGAGEKFQLADNMGDEMNRTKALQNVRAAIDNHPNARVLVGIWSYNGPAIVDVVKSRDRRKDFTIVTFDGEPASIEMMDQGDIDCMIVQNPFDIGYQGVRLMKALVEGDKKTVREMLPNERQSGGDIYETGLKIVVPDQGSPLKPEMFDTKTEFLTLSQFKEWLKKYGLKGS
jgi:ribose transport system substrate-binding protein